ncbi:probable protein phosphatase 2C 26 isoform X3 [Punica granatum]|uniref:Protein phosphatase n=1 Tax=Punica granatum TaxID=22663 RepID=A0A6P8E5T3_PUNGR|nr:probable protein phosphatase 2C 26 isoform X3 [Punica granatum]
MATAPTPTLIRTLGASLSQSSCSRLHPHLLPLRYPTKRHRRSSSSCCRTSLFCAPNGPLGEQLTPETESDVCLCVGTHLIPHPNKIDKGGEDAYLVSTFNGGVLAVADGVSGWAEQKVDPSLFSRELMTNASSLLEQRGLEEMLLKEAHAATSSVGSATVIIAMLERGRILKIANVGDCGLRVIRQGKVVFSTSPQEHYFDCPHQLSSEVVGQTYLDAVMSTVEVMEQDTIVMGSDGLFDNVFDHEIVSAVTRYSDVSETAKALCDLANTHSMDPSFDSPYSVEARAKGFDIPLWKKILGMKLTGGKLDDITVIVGRVVRTQSAA